MVFVRKTLSNAGGKLTSGDDVLFLTPWQESKVWNKENQYTSTIDRQQPEVALNETVFIK